MDCRVRRALKKGLGGGMKILTTRADLVVLVLILFLTGGLCIPPAALIDSPVFRDDNGMCE
jgi:hypothetical protein